MVITQKKKKTEAEGQTFIKERERRAKMLMEAGASAAGAVRTATGQIGQRMEQESPVLQALAQRDKEVATLQIAQLEAGRAGQIKPNIQQPISREERTEPQSVAAETTQGKISMRDVLGIPRRIRLFGPSAEEQQEILRSPITEARGELAKTTLKTAAEVIDTLTGVFSLRKKGDVITAEASFNDAATKIRSDLNMVKLGLKDPVEVKANFQLARSAINKLESSQKIKGMINLRYWVGGGDEIAGEIEIFKQTMDDFERELNAISQNYQSTQNIQLLRMQEAQNI